MRTIHVNPTGMVRRCPDFPNDFHWTEFRKYEPMDCNACYFACRGEAQAPLRLDIQRTRARREQDKLRLPGAEPRLLRRPPHREPVAQLEPERIVCVPRKPRGTAPVGSFVVGYIREISEFNGGSIGLGVRGSVNVIPAALEPSYGTRTPGGFSVFLRFRPSRSNMGGMYSGTPDGHEMMDMPSHDPHSRQSDAQCSRSCASMRR